MNIWQSLISIFQAQTILLQHGQQGQQNGQQLLILQDQNNGQQQIIRQQQQPQQQQQQQYQIIQVGNFVIRGFWTIWFLSKKILLIP